MSSIVPLNDSKLGERFLAAGTLNREAWLTELAKRFEPKLKGYKIGPYRVTCGWPCKLALGKRTRRVGECHGVESSAGGLCEIFVSPTLEVPLEVAGVLCHEIIHVVAGSKAAHKSPFVKIAHYAGLTKGKPTQILPGDKLNEYLSKIIEELGPYPHRALNPAAKIVKPSSDIALRCSCGCRFRIAAKWIEQSGIPTCGCGNVMEIV